MLDRLKNSEKVVGTRRLVRAILVGEIAEAYVAQDADLFIDTCVQGLEHFIFENPYAGIIWR